MLCMRTRAWSEGEQPSQDPAVRVAETGCEPAVLTLPFSMDSIVCARQPDVVVQVVHCPSGLHQQLWWGQNSVQTRHRNLRLDHTDGTAPGPLPGRMADDLRERRDCHILEGGFSGCQRIPRHHVWPLASMYVPLPRNKLPEFIKLPPNPWAWSPGQAHFFLE